MTRLRHTVTAIFSKGNAMQYHQPTKKFVIEKSTIEATAESLRYAIKAIREAGGKPLTAYEVSGMDNYDHAQAAIMDVAQSLDIDLGHRRFNMIDVTEAN